MIRFFQLALWLCHWKTPAAERLLRQVTTLTRFVLAEKVAELKKWVRKSPNVARRGAFLTEASQRFTFGSRIASNCVNTVQGIRP